jgi:hypothetical protein
MTPEDKNLLLKDLCARLPSGIRYKGDGGWGINPHQHTTAVSTILNSEEPLLYLRSTLSMTEEEFYIIKSNWAQLKEGNWLYECVDEITTLLNSHHFDYRGLIEKGLALEAPEGMYK